MNGIFNIRIPIIKCIINEIQIDILFANVDDINLIENNDFNQCDDISL